ncbi:anaerobic ribonucleoside-triphosphate reductase activating protein [Permianibacter fluminis]|uniref:anaerobic ribonucleoside-triphosphate reductase activating protein n=1 Tax=Permianibacter fluminis TaxID=2738515 RepID=UPI001B7D8D36|nr:anaerobic ribonucleoside-triphosphate reductase activating protein [Permianibacter fluminis]
MHKSADQLRIGGYTPLTTIDYPGELAAVIFCQGCPWRCAYCQNEHLLDAGAATPYQWPDIRRHLEQRRGLLDAVVLSGGEPTAQAACLQVAAELKVLGFKIGLHTGGAYPDRLRQLLPLCDWVGLDLKTVPEHYDLLTVTPGSGARAWQSLQHVLSLGIRYEVRTTVHWHLLSAQRLLNLAEQLRYRGVQHWAVQLCHTDQGYSRRLPSNVWTDSDRQFVLQQIAPQFAHFELRE